MQNNYYLLKKLTPILNNNLQSMHLGECYTQNKDELIFGFYTPGISREIFIRAMLRPDFCCLSFPEKLHRAKKNSVDIFPGALDRKVEGVRQFLNERAFLITLEGNYGLLFKMHGNRSNVILVKNDQPEEIFNSRLAKDHEIDVGALDRPIDQSFEAFVKEDGDFTKLFPTFGKEVKQWIKSRDYEKKDLKGKWQVIEETLKYLEDDNYYVMEEDLPSFSLLPPAEFASDYSDPLEAVSRFYILWLSRKNLYERKSVVVKSLGNEVKKLSKNINNAESRLKKIETTNNYREWADLLMANLHNVTQGEKKVELQNFYNENRPVTITLNERLSPQKNAERYYQKAKNQHKELKILKEKITSWKNLLKEKSEQLNLGESTSDVTLLKSLMPEQQNSKQEKLPYHYFNLHGFDVLVGKNSRDNDELLRSHTKKDDLWLHARAVSGSHVIVKSDGRNVPREVLEKAAQLAAYNSKGKNDSLCAVIFTPRKYVRKRKGDPPGAVVVEREEVVMVQPKLPDS